MKQLILGLKLFFGVVALAFCAQVTADYMRQNEGPSTPGATAEAVDLRILDHLDNQQNFAVRKAFTQRMQLLSGLIQSYDERMRQLQRRILDTAYVNTPEQLDYQQTLLDHAMQNIVHFERKLEAHLRDEAAEFRKQGLSEPVVQAVVLFEKPYLEAIAKQWKKLFRIQRDHLTGAAEAVNHLKLHLGNYTVVDGRIRFVSPEDMREYRRILSTMATHTNLMGEAATTLDSKRRAFSKAMEDKFVLG